MFTVLRPRHRAAVLIFSLALAGASGAADLSTREEAVAGLSSTDAELRRDAVDSLARLGLAPDAELLLDALYDADPDVRVHAEGAVWQLWGRSGDADVDTLLKSGIRHMDDGQMGQAVELFTRVTERKPEFAEGWNKRATAYYLMGDYEQSLKDCDEVLKRNPHHFGALSGYGLIYVKRGELERALEYFQRALEINPNMQGVEQSIELIRYKLGKDGKQDT
jgi:tetratricopeptide (TPR) repeat protein